MVSVLVRASKREALGDNEEDKLDNLQAPTKHKPADTLLAAVRLLQPLYQSQLMPPPYQQ